MPHAPARPQCPHTVFDPTLALEMRTCRWCHKSYDADDPADVLWHRPGGCTTL